MIKNIIIVNHLGESLALKLDNTSHSGFIIKSVDGLGPVKGTINISNLTTIDGGIYNSARKNSRNIVFTFIYDMSAGETIEEIRHRSYKYFPLKQCITVIIETDTRVLKTSGYVESDEQIIFEEQTGTQISIICPNSDFIDANNNVESYDINKDVAPTFSFPFANNEISCSMLSFGAILPLTKLSIDFTGDTENGVNIVLHFNDDILDDTSDPNHTLSPDSLVLVQDHANSDIEPFSLYLPSITIDLEKMQESDCYPKKGDTIVISTGIGKKRMTLNGNINLFPFISSDIFNENNWFKLYPGVNYFYCYIDKINQDEMLEQEFDHTKNSRIINVSISYDKFYEGV